MHSLQVTVHWSNARWKPLPRIDRNLDDLELLMKILTYSQTAYALGLCFGHVNTTAPQLVILPNGPT